MWLLWSIIGCIVFVVQFDTSKAQTECIQRHPITRDISKVLICEEGCCGKELTYQVCCETLAPDKMYTDYDKKRGLSPIHYFLMVFSVLLASALTAALIFCLVRCGRNDKRSCSWI